MANATQERNEALPQQLALQEALVALEHLKRLQQESSSRIEAGIHDLERRIQRLIATGTAEQLETFDWQRQYEQAVATLQKFELAGANLPTLEAVQGAFTPEKQAAIATLKDPTLILVPDISFAAKVRAIDASGLAPNSTYVNEDVFGPMGKEKKGKKPVAYRPVVIEGGQEMDIVPHDDRTKILRDRIAATQRNRSAHASGLDREQYAMLQMHALAHGDPVDRQTWTILDGDCALKDNAVPCGDWRDDQVVFGGYHAVDVFVRARFRSSVGGDVLES